MKKSANKTVKNWHTPRASKDSGDHYGSGIKQKIGRIRDIFPVDGFSMNNKNQGKAPKSLA
jgi:hypothetical protein